MFVSTFVLMYGGNVFGYLFEFLSNFKLQIMFQDYYLSLNGLSQWFPTYGTITTSGTGEPSRWYVVLVSKDQIVDQKGK